jgi:hypothetical protein
MEIESMVDPNASLITAEPTYQERIQDWEALWNLEETPRPRWLLSTPPSLMPMFTGQYPLTEYFGDKEMQLKAELEILAWRETLDIGDMFVPHLQPYCGVTAFASPFGCRVEFFEHTLPWAHPVIQSSDSAEKVYELPQPSVTSGQLGEMLEFTDYFVEQTESRYPIAVTDLQGPMDTAYLVWDSTEFMMAMYTHPQEVHHLMRLVTDLIIDYVKEQRARSPQFVPFHYPSLWLPDGQGIAISDDALAVLSPQTYEEFALPYANELSEEFGGLFIHSCGNFVHQFDNLEKVRRLRGLNFGATETPFEAVWERFNGKTAIVPHKGLNKDIHFETKFDYIEHVLQTKSHNRGLIVLVTPEVTDFMGPGGIAGLAERINRLLDRYA